MLKSIEVQGFKSFAKKSELEFSAPISCIVGPNGSGKSNVTEALRFVLGEQSMKSLRSKRGEDLIWSGSQGAPRSGRASAEIVFDNRKRMFDMDFDEVSLKRVVSRDGLNEYFVNGSAVRLKDVMELLSGVHVGASGHHIISQGEADRILNTSAKERRNIVEDALGLKIYHFKITESEKKLKKTEENMKEVEALRREIAPHMRFLKKQVEKVEKAQELREKLRGLYAEYLKRESLYLAHAGDEHKTKKKELSEKLEGVEKRIIEAQARIAGQENGEDVEDTSRRLALEDTVKKAREKKETAGKELGRIEGMLSITEERIARAEKETHHPVSHESVTRFLDGLEEVLTDTNDMSVLARIVRDVKKRIEEFRSSVVSESREAEIATAQEERVRLENEQRDAHTLFEKASNEEDAARRALADYEREVAEKKSASRTAETELYAYRAEKSEISTQIARVEDALLRIEKDSHAFEEEIREGMVLIGGAIRDFETYTCDETEALAEAREAQEDRRRSIERIKIRLEETGVGGGEDVLKEYEETAERDAFFATQLKDLEETAASLRTLAADLEAELDTAFKSGLEKINDQFNTFFTLMFGGGSASLTLVKTEKRKKKDEDIEVDMDDVSQGVDTDESASVEEGIDIVVSLPRKKIHGLQMLSGGERALTSIALIFAMSQINPPPFLVLDETDAALDEANSRRYGDMLENLAKHSQLIVVTHNRETMSRAGVLYGVTMGSDAVSRLISVKFEEAEAYAK
jgi:chromosome segregation ATPase